MPWGWIDDGFYDHDKVLEMPVALRNEACGLYWRAISYCNAKLTDGVVSESVVVLLDGRPDAVDALLAARLWHRRRGGGYIVHDFLEGYNKSRAEVLAIRAKKAAAGRLGGQKSGEARRNRKPSKREAGASSVVHGRLNSESVAVSVSESGDSPPPPAKRGRRLNGDSPRGLGENLRATSESPRQNGTSPRQEREDQKRGSIVLSDSELERLQAERDREEVATPEEIKTAVAAYLARNPLSPKPPLPGKAGGSDA